MAYSGHEEEKLILNEELISLDLDVSNDKEALKVLGENLLKEGLVKDSFIDAIIERENNYPTAIETLSLGVAIPHTDTIHVNKASMAIGILKKPINFKGMGTDEDVKVSIIFMLAIKDPDQQLGMLQKLVGIFQDQETLKTIYEGKDRLEIKSIIDSLLFHQ